MSSSSKAVSRSGISDSRSSHFVSIRILSRESVNVIYPGFKLVISGFWLKNRRRFFRQNAVTEVMLPLDPPGDPGHIISPLSSGRRSGAFWIIIIVT